MVTMLDLRGVVSPSEKTRAQRFDLHIPLRYRTDGEGDWHKGTTRNISRSGVLFQAEDWAEPRSHVEITWLLPGKAGVDGAAEVVCRGLVMRSEQRTTGDGGPLVAIRISRYRLVRRTDERRTNQSAHH